MPSLNYFTLCTSLKNPSHTHVVILCNWLACAHVFGFFFHTFFSLCYQTSTDFQCNFISPDKYEATTVHINQLMFQVLQYSSNLLFFWNLKRTSPTLHCDGVCLFVVLWLLLVIGSRYY